MSFGWSAGDVATLVKYAYTVVSNCRKACGEYDELTRQVTSLHRVLRSIGAEQAKADGLLNRRGDEVWEDLCPAVQGSESVLKALNAIVKKYAGINRRDTTLGRLWQRAKFGNKELSDLNDLRQRARFYTQSISTILDTVAVGSLGRIEKQIDEAGLRDLKPAIEDLAKKFARSTGGGGSVFTAYTNDETKVWRELRRELVKAGIAPSGVIKKNRDLIKAFIQDLGNRGDLDEESSGAGEDDPAGVSDAESEDSGDSKCNAEAPSQEQFREHSRPSTAAARDGSGTGAEDDEGNARPRNTPFRGRSFEERKRTNLGDENANVYPVADPAAALKQFVLRKVPDLPELLRGERFSMEMIMGTHPPSKKWWYLATPWGHCLMFANMNITLIQQDIDLLTLLVRSCSKMCGELTPGRLDLLAIMGNQTVDSQQEDMRTLQRHKEAFERFDERRKEQGWLQSAFIYGHRGFMADSWLRDFGKEARQLTKTFWNECADVVRKTLNTMDYLDDLSLQAIGTPRDPRWEGDELRANLFTEYGRRHDYEALDKLRAIMDVYQEEHLKAATRYSITKFPFPRARSMERRRVSEGILVNVLMEIDKIESQNTRDFQRARKRAVQTVQQKLDELEKDSQ